MKKYSDTESKSIAKKLLILLCVILIIFAAINGVWYFGHMKPYVDVSRKMEAYYLDENDSSSKRYRKEIGEYEITMSMPSYLGSGGRIAVCGNVDNKWVELDENGNVISGGGLVITLYAWPQYFGKCPLGLDFDDQSTGLWMQIMVDENMELVDTDKMDDDVIKEANKLIEENREEITELFNALKTLK